MARGARAREARRAPEGAAATLWIPAERLTQFRALWPEARLEPEIAPPPDQAGTTWSHEQALVEILRGRLEGLGPVTQTALTAPLGLEPGAAAGALAALESEGAILRGRFLPGVNDEQWCDRRLLARIHHYTIRRLRSEIDPVAARDFLRFLFAWQHVAEETRLEGPDALPAVLASLEGFEAPARAWETEILPARLKDYEAVVARRPVPRRANRLGAADAARRRGAAERAACRRSARRRSRCSIAAGRRSGCRLRRRRRGSPKRARSGPCSIACARGARCSLTNWPKPRVCLRPEARGGAGRTRGARARDLRQLRRLARAARAVGPAQAARRREAARAGAALRHRERRPLGDHPPRRAEGRRRRGRGAAAVEHAARTLLARYGVVFWRLLAQEPGWLPPWRDLLRVYRRLEARGEIRGGRFVAGFSGEQFALPEAVGLMREIRRRPASGQWVSLSGADPLNLVGILTPGQRLAALTANRVVYRDGLPVAALSGGKTQFLTDLETATNGRRRSAWCDRPRAGCSPISPERPGWRSTAVADAAGGSN